MIYNRNGKLYRFDLDTGKPTLLDTDSADRNNNDHVISFDGKSLAISHHAADQDGQSLVYTLPVSGGKPTLITKSGPSYLHGWSPDGKWLVYTGGRNDTKGDAQGISGTFTSVRGDNEPETVDILNPTLVGNQLTFDVEREFRGNAFTMTFQGIVHDDKIVGWTMMEFNGTQRDSNWTAERE